MEARRLGILCSHLNPSSPYTTRDSILRASDCTSGSTSDEKVDSSNLQNDCVFCKIVRGESPSLKLYEDDMCLCILDTSPLIHGHSLIIPKLHYPTLEQTPLSVVAAMCSKVPLISNAIVKATDSDSSLNQDSNSHQIHLTYLLTTEQQLGKSYFTRTFT
ncbi:adenylylsulfatase HINT3 isoform X3 [Raphanus sativus]|uniref:Adenylylsulfatase HINT3 isoform X3 n=1 Tax=Raphanus sativus TaxID=3726 RepID=A0A9W3CFW7_RAPSA|nr:adenylylsulfatase HINT3 isoform X3 [Raphanus sativus]